MTSSFTCKPGAKCDVQTRRGRVHVGLVVVGIVVAIVVVAVLLAPAMLFASLSPVGTFRAEPSSVVIELESSSAEVLNSLVSILTANMVANLATGIDASAPSKLHTNAEGVLFAQHHSFTSQHLLRDLSGGANPIPSPLDFDAFVEDMNVVLPGLLSEAPAESTLVAVRYGLPDGSAVLVARVEYVDGVARFVTSRESVAPK